MKMVIDYFSDVSNYQGISKLLFVSDTPIGWHDTLELWLATVFPPLALWVVKINVCHKRQLQS